MNIKDQAITELTLKQYADLTDLDKFRETDKVMECYDKIVDIINESNLYQADVISMVKRIAINTISQCNEEFVDYIEKIDKEQFQRENK